MSFMEGVQRFKLPLEEIKLGTNNFDDQNFIGGGGFGKVYNGNLTVSGQQASVAVKRLDPSRGQGNREFLMEIHLLSRYRHKNLVSLVGFCDDNGEHILVYEYAKYGSLDRYLSSNELTWLQRLQISLGAARGFNYLHNDVDPQHRVLHRDIKSPNILLDENWNAKVSDFGLSKVGPSNVELTFIVTGPCGTLGYVDPQYLKTGILTKESDVYSFGVVLFEILCGRLALVRHYKEEDEHRFLAFLAQKYYEQKRLDEIIHPNIKSEMKVDSLNTFSMTAYECLKENRSERPTMGWIVEQLEKALELQAGNIVAGFVRMVTWGRESGGPENQWSFELKKDHTLQKITIGHGDVINSLMFTTECRGVLQTSNKAGGWAGEKRISEITFDGDEEIVGIEGRIGHRDGHAVISLLSFKTTKRTHGPFGWPDGKSVFSVPWDKGCLVGFYGLAGNNIDSIGVYVKATEGIASVGTWGAPGDSPFESWSFQLERNHHLRMITIRHDYYIGALRFTTHHRGVNYESQEFGTFYGNSKVTRVRLHKTEEINGISGTVGFFGAFKVISSISLVTNKKSYGPYGDTNGTPFTLPFADGSFAGFYGTVGRYNIHSIGVHLKPQSNLMSRLE